MCMHAVSSVIPTLCDPMDCSLSSSSVHGILQARILKWVAMPSSRGCSPPRETLMFPALTGRSFITSATWEAQEHFFIYSFQNYSSIFCPLKFLKIQFSVLFSSVAQLCLTLCNPMNCSTSCLPVHHQLLESAQTRVHWVGDAIQPSHPLSSPSPPALNLSQHQGIPVLLRYNMHTIKFNIFGVQF